jgi:small-conductance mechanosensitive channel
MEKCENDSHRSWSLIRKLLPTIILIALAALAGGTDVFSSQVHELVSKGIHDRFAELMPYVVNFLFAVIVLNVGWLMHHRCLCGVDRILAKTSASPHVSGFVSKAFKLAYWLLVVFIALACVAPDFMGKVAAGATIVTAALALALQNMINDFIAGILLQGSDCVKEGQEIKVNDVSIADGKVIKIGYVRTLIENKENGPVSVPNSKIWTSSIAKKPKPKSKLILPDDFGKDEAKKETADTKK